MCYFCWGNEDEYTPGIIENYPYPEDDVSTDNLKPRLLTERKEEK